MNIRSSLIDLFGAIGNTNVAIPASPSNIDFIPTDSEGGTINIKGNGKGAAWLGLRSKYQQRRAYEFCFPVATVIDRLAEYDLTGTVEIFRRAKKGKNKVLDNEWATRVKALLEKPNHLQGWYQFRGQQLVYKRTFGFCHVLPLFPAGVDETDRSNAYALLNIPPWCIEPISNRIFISGQLSTVLQGWRVTILGKQTILKPEQVMLLQDGFHQDEKYDFLLPMSKLVGLDMAVSNVCAAMEADNVLLKKRGPLGFISHDAAAVKDSQVGYIPMSPQQKKTLQEDLARYGLTLAQYQYVISRTAAKWIPMGSNVKELQTKETVTQGEKIICHRLGFPYILYEESDATYANGDNAAATVYQTNVIPNANRDFNDYNVFFGSKLENADIRIDFSHVAALQEDEEYKATALLANNQALEIMWLNGQITKNMWLERVGFETIGPEGDVYYVEPTEPDADNIDIPLSKPKRSAYRTLRAAKKHIKNKILTIQAHA